MAINIIQPSDSPDPLGPAGLGNVPTIGGNVSTAIPPAPGVPSAVQDQQSAGTATQAVAQAIVLPPIPYAVIQRLDPSGSLTMWLQTLVRKLGGYTSTPATDAELLSDWGNVNTVGQFAALVRDLSALDQPQLTPILPPLRVEDLWDDGDDAKAWVKGHNFLSSVSVTAPITGAGTAGSPLAMAAATGSVPGYLTDADWTTFNGKQAALGFTPVNKAGDSGIGALTMSGLTVSSASNGVLNLDGASASQPKILFQVSGASKWAVYTDPTSSEYRIFSAGTGGDVFKIAYATGAVTFSGNVGFNGTAAIAKPTVTGSRGGNAALASLLTALASYGLITDSTSA